MVLDLLSGRIDVVHVLFLLWGQKKSYYINYNLALGRFKFKRLCIYLGNCLHRSAMVVDR